MPTDRQKDDWSRWIEQINDFGLGLTEWEVSFMESLTDQWDRIGSLSARQVEILERIYAEKTP